MNSVELSSSSSEETQSIGRLIGNLCLGGECLLLHGPLGAGKTCLVKGLAVGLGIDEEEPVVSPTFVLHIQYFGRVEFNHIDAYRLGPNADVSQLGFDELIEGKGVTAIEWAEYIEHALPPACLQVEIDMVGPESRSIRISAPGCTEATYRHLLEPLQNRSSEIS